ncbi:hypothetical protein PoB_007562200 [Plakobranchus ocellatus]|uniref:Uncharacterized protein n=1 Tax=Plakobranchus ocellatus TaxID=259542 RepID=A0AAV4DYL4_9GAST|nr:hypothetical protein PoB_007562200 [Plakobranchus ocellatus]
MMMKAMEMISETAIVQTLVIDDDDDFNYGENDEENGNNGDDEGKVKPFTYSRPSVSQLADHNIEGQMRQWSGLGHVQSGCGLLMSNTRLHTTMTRNDQWSRNVQAQSSTEPRRELVAVADGA